MAPTIATRATPKQQLGNPLPPFHCLWCGRYWWVKPDPAGAEALVLAFNHHRCTKATPVPAARGVA